LSCCCTYADAAASRSGHIVLIGSAVAVVIQGVAIIVCTGGATGGAGVLEVSADADHLSCCCTYTDAAASRSGGIVLIGRAIAVVIQGVAIIV
jgi:predicted RecA/RadA family phage recombinase